MHAILLLSEVGEGINTSLQELLFAGIAFFLLIVIVGWLTSSRKQDQADSAQDTKKG